MISILTPTIPEREQMVVECKRSVASQTYQAYEHLTGYDADYEGCSVTINRLAERAVGQWLLPLADDDLLLPGCLQTLIAHVDEGDIIYSRPLVWGNDSPHFFAEPPKIPSFALIPRMLWQELGGYDEDARREEDRKLWIKALDVGAKFVLVEDGPTWVYRFSLNADGKPRNKSYNGGISS